MYIDLCTILKGTIHTLFFEKNRYLTISYNNSVLIQNASIYDWQKQLTGFEWY